MLTEMTDESKIIETVVRAHYDTCDYTRNKMEPFIQKAKAANSFVTDCSGEVIIIASLFACKILWRKKDGRLGRPPVPGIGFAKPPSPPFAAEQASLILYAAARPSSSHSFFLCLQPSLT